MVSAHYRNEANEHNINPVIKGLEHDNDSYRDRVRPKIENTGISLEKTF